MKGEQSASARTFAGRCFNWHGHSRQRAGAELQRPGISKQKNAHETRLCSGGTVRSGHKEKFAPAAAIVEMKAGTPLAQCAAQEQVRLRMAHGCSPHQLH
jgi:hypothetical protein